MKSAFSLYLSCLMCRHNISSFTTQIPTARISSSVKSLPFFSFTNVFESLQKSASSIRSTPCLRCPSAPLTTHQSSLNLPPSSKTPRTHTYKERDSQLFILPVQLRVVWTPNILSALGPGQIFLTAGRPGWRDALWWRWCCRCRR